MALLLGAVLRQGLATGALRAQVHSVVLPPPALCSSSLHNRS